MTTISDDFNRADGALGASWTNHAGSADINTNRFRCQTASFGTVLYTHVTSLSGVAQYIKVQFGTENTLTFAEFVFRFTDASSPYYVVQVDQDGGEVEWYHYDEVEGTSTSIQTSTFALGFGTGSVGITVDGTGSGTVVRLWRNPTGDAPTDASTWGGAAAGITLTNDPGSPVDTGNIVGIGGVQNAANTLFFDSFWAGDIGGGAAAALSIAPIMQNYRNMGLVH